MNKLLQSSQFPALSRDSTLSQVLEALATKVFQNRPSGFALVLGETGEMAGVITDADIRKFVSKNGKLPETANEVMNAEFIWAPEGLSETEIAQFVAEQANTRGWGTDFPVRFIPLLDSKRNPTAIVDLMNLEVELKKYRDSIVVIGLGYVGLTVAIALAKSGSRVAAVDISEKKISMLRAGRSPIFEPGINELLQSLNGKKISYFTRLEEIPEKRATPTTYVLCLPTPLDHSTRTLSSKALQDFLPSLVPLLRQGDSIVMRSTVPIGTGAEVIRQIETHRNWTVGSDFYYAHAPERTVEGNALKEIQELPQILGGATPYCGSRIGEFFERICSFVVPVSSIESAELIKIAGNGFRDHIFAFSNQLAEVARDLNVDVDEVIEKSNLGYKRSTIPSPSPGVGGPCLTKDSYLLKSRFQTTSPVEASRLYNEGVPMQVVGHILRNVPESKRSRGIMLGLAFKGHPATNDLRDSTNVETARLVEQHFKELVSWDAVADFRELRNGLPDAVIDEPQEFQFIAIMNNHPDNPITLARLLKARTTSDAFFLFDPWRMVDPLATISHGSMSSITYLTMSTAQYHEGYVEE